MPGFTVLAVPYFFQAGQSSTSRASPILMFIATAPPLDEPTTTCGWCLSNSAWAILTASVEVLVGQLRVDDLVAVLGQEGRFDAAWDRLPAVQEEDFHRLRLDLLRLIADESFIDGNFDQIGVGVTEVDRPEWPDRPRPGHRAFKDRHAQGVQMLDDLGQRSVGDEAQVSGTGRGLRRLRLELLALLVQIDLLRAERQRLASLPEGDDLHPHAFFSASFLVCHVH